MPLKPVTMTLSSLTVLLAVSGCSEPKADDGLRTAAKSGANCVIPTKLPRPKAERAPAPGPSAPEITRYTLALSWSPQFCRQHANDPQHANQCGAPQAFGFVLHGLWPEGAGRNAPAWCAPAEVLPADVIRINFCASPSPQLLQHEWAKHGTCMTRDPAAYFEKARTLYESVKLPDMERLSRSGTSVSELVSAIVQLNPTIPARAISVDTSRGNWLTEIKICYDATFQPTACTNAGRARKGSALKIWRSDP